MHLMLNHSCLILPTSQKEADCSVVVFINKNYFKSWRKVACVQLQKNKNKKILLVDAQ